MMSLDNSGSKKVEISELAKTVLSIDPLHRKDEDLDKLIEDGSFSQLAFIKDIFKTKQESNLKAFLKCLRMFSLSPNEDVYKIGDRPKECFFLIEGSLDIFAPEMKRVGSTSHFLMKHKRSIRQGEMFGEKEIITQSSSRESTVCSTDHSLIGKLSKRDYYKIYDTIIRRFQHDYLALFKEIKLFSSKGKPFIEKFVREMIVKDFKAGEQILYQDKPCDMLYIIKSGSVKVVNEERSDSYYSFDYNEGEMFGDIEIFLNKPCSQFSVYSGETTCQLFCCQREAFARLLGAFISEFNSLTQTKIERIKAGIGELNKSKLFRSHSVYQRINLHSTWLSKTDEEDGSNNDTNFPQFDLNYNHIQYKANDNHTSYKRMVKQTTKGVLYKNQPFFRRPMKSITAISCKIDECQRIKARESIINMVPFPKSAHKPKLKLMPQDNRSSIDFYPDAAMNHQLSSNSALNQHSHLSFSSSKSSFAPQRNSNKKKTYELSTEEKIKLLSSQLKFTPSLIQALLPRRTSFSKKILMNRDRVLSLFCSNLELMKSHS